VKYTGVLSKAVTVASAPGTGSPLPVLPPAPPEPEEPELVELSPDDAADVEVDDGDSPEPPQPSERAIVARQTVSRGEPKERMRHVTTVDAFPDPGTDAISCRNAHDLSRRG
jgi:hypothetical protein